MVGSPEILLWRSLPVANETDVLALQVGCGVPCCTVQECALVVLQAGNCRPFPGVENTRSIDEYMTSSCDSLLSGSVKCSDVPHGLLLVPSGVDHSVLKLNVLF